MKCASFSFQRKNHINEFFKHCAILVASLANSATLVVAQNRIRTNLRAPSRLSHPTLAPRQRKTMDEVSHTAFEELQGIDKSGVQSSIYSSHRTPWSAFSSCRLLLFGDLIRFYQHCHTTHIKKPPVKYTVPDFSKSIPAHGLSKSTAVR